MAHFDAPRESESSSPDLDAVSAYDYDLPDRLIAAHPAQQRSQSRLLVAQRGRDGQQQGIEHRQFRQLPDHLKEADLLVFNDTQVIPARVMTRKETGGVVELFVLDLVDPVGPARWTAPAERRLDFRCMTRSSRPLRAGMHLQAEADADIDFVVDQWEAGRAVVHVDVAADLTTSAVDFLDRVGQTPLPPYIVKRRQTLGQDDAPTRADRQRYQTVYAERPGAVAAPTAGLHFGDELLDELDADGVRQAFVTLQVGAGTFRPVSAERLSDHDMHSEEYRISAELGDAIDRTHRRGGRVIAVGTTSVRALEAEARRDQAFEPGVRRTDLFLHPGVDFEVCDGLITNFHLPRSTLLALVSAFAGYDFTRQIYATAVEQEYRFYSYGDAMLIV